MKSLLRSTASACLTARGPSRLGVLVLVLLAVVCSVLAPSTGVALGLAGLAGTQTVTSLNEAMKVTTSIPLVRQYVAESEFLSMFQTETNVQTETTGTGRYIETAHFRRLSAGVGARHENDYLPEPNPAAFDNGRIYLKKLTGVLEMTGDTMERVNGDTEAFLTWMDEAMPQFAERVAHESDRMALGFGYGVKARIEAFTGTRGGISFTNGVSAHGSGRFSICVDRALGINGLSDAWLQFMEGDQIVFSASIVPASIALKAAGTNQSAMVDNIDDDNGVLTLVGASALQAAVAAGDYVALGDKAGHSFPNAAGEEREFSGMLAHVDDGTYVSSYFGLNRTSATRYRSIVVNASSNDYAGVLSEDLLAFVDDTVSIRSAGKIDTVVTSRPGVRGYWRSLRGDRSFIDPRAMEGGKSAAMQVLLGDRLVTLKVARKMPPELAFALDTTGFIRISPNAWEWDDTTGSIFKPWTDGVGRKHQFYAFGTAYEQLFNKTPRRNARIEGLARQF